MIDKSKNGSSTFWVSVITAGILACLGGVIYTFFMIQGESLKKVVFQSKREG